MKKIVLGLVILLNSFSFLSAQNYFRPADKVASITLSNTTETTLIAADSTGKHVLTGVIITNLSTANVVTVSLRRAVGGTIVFSPEIPFSSGSSGNYRTIFLPLSNGGLIQSSINQSITVQATGTSPSVKVEAIYYTVK